MSSPAAHRDQPWMAPLGYLLAAPVDKRQGQLLRAVSTFGPARNHRSGQNARLASAITSTPREKRPLFGLLGKLFVNPHGLLGLFQRLLTSAKLAQHDGQIVERHCQVGQKGNPTIMCA
jgi:hypothetical protein